MGRVQIKEARGSGDAGAQDPGRGTTIGFRAVGACGARAGCSSAARV